MAKRNSGACEPVVKVSDITREQWLEYRRTGIGGSDASTIVGLNPYSSPYYLFCDKIGRTARKRRHRSNAAGPGSGAVCGRSLDGANREDLPPEQLHVALHAVALDAGRH